MNISDGYISKYHKSSLLKYREKQKSKRLKNFLGWTMVGVIVFSVIYLIHMSTAIYIWSKSF